MKIIITIDQLGGGGGARVTSLLCKGLIENGHNVTILTDNKNYPIVYPFPSEVNIRTLYFEKKSQSIFGSITKNIKYAKKIREYIKNIQPDVVIAIMHFAFRVTKLAMINSSIPLIACDHTSFSRHISKIDDFTRYYLYKTANALTILSYKDEKLLGKKFPNKIVIYNPLSFPIITQKLNRRQNILCVARLDAWEIKGIDIILKIWKDLYKKYPDWTLEIAGTGCDKSIEYIQNLITKFQLKNVNLLGHIEDMQKLYSETSIFALPSRIEGFPMSLLEAISQGCACISFELEGVVNEIINNETSGLIIKDGDIQAFKNKLSFLIENKEIRTDFSQQAVLEAQKFTLNNFISKWEYLLETVVNSNGK